MYILDCLKVGSNVYSSIDHSPGGKPNTPSHPVTAGHVADGQRGSGVGALLAVLVMDTSWQYCRVLGIQDQRVARV